MPTTNHNHPTPPFQKTGESESPPSLPSRRSLLARAAKGVALIAAGAVAEAGFHPIEGLCHTVDKLASRTTGAPTTQPLAEVHAPDPFLKTEQLPENLRPVHSLIEADPQLKTKYRSLVVHLEGAYSKLLAQVRAVDDQTAFGMRRQSIRFPEREFEKRKADTIGYVERLIQQREAHLLSLLAAAGMEHNPGIAQRLLTIKPTTYVAKSDLYCGGQQAAGLANLHTDNRKLFSHGIATHDRSDLEIDLNEAYPEENFRGVVTHEEFHGMLQAGDREEKQEYDSSFYGVPEERSRPIHAAKSGLYLANEYLYEGITELLAKKACALAGPEGGYMSYHHPVVIAALLMGVDQKAVMDWYCGLSTNQQAYERLEQGLAAKGIREPMAMKLLNLAFEDKAFGWEGTAERAAWSLSLGLQERGSSLASLISGLNLPEPVKKAVESYEMPNRMDPHQSDSLLKSDISFVQIKDKVNMPLRCLASYWLMLHEDHPAALSALGAGLGRERSFEAQRLLEAAIKKEPQEAIHHIRYARSFDFLPRPTRNAGDYINQEFTKISAAYEEALRLDTANKQTRFEFGVVLIKYAVASGKQADRSYDQHVKQGLSLLKEATTGADKVRSAYDLERLVSTDSISWGDWGGIIAESDPALKKELDALCARAK